MIFRSFFFNPFKFQPTLTNFKNVNASILYALAPFTPWKLKHGKRYRKWFIVDLCTREVTEQLYTAAKAFSELPASETQALTDALRWAKKCNELKSNVAAFSELVEALDAKKR